MSRKKPSAGGDSGSHARGAASQRQLRVGEEMRHVLAGIISDNALSDPDLTKHQVTVTAVNVSPDLRNATAFVVPFGVAIDTEIDTDALVAALNRAAGFFRGQLAREVKLRVSPTLRFRLDESFQQANRIEALLHDPLVARDLIDPPEKDPDHDSGKATDKSRDDDGQA